MAVTELRFNSLSKETDLLLRRSILFRVSSMRYFSIPLLAVFAFLSAVPQLSAQDFEVPRQSYATPSRLPASNASSTIQEDDKSQLGVMGEVTSKYVDIDNAFAQLIEDVEVPAEETGKLVDIAVKRGDMVTENTIVAQIDSLRTQRMLEEARLKYQQANDRALDETSVKAANQKLKLAKEEYEYNSRLHQRGSVSKKVRDHAKYTKDIAELEHIAAVNERALAKLEAETLNVAVKAAEDSIARHQLRSTLNGTVFEVLKDKGEWVQAGETVLRIARMDKLRIQGSVDSTVFNPPQIDGRRVTATLKLAGGQTEEFTGKVTYVSSENYGKTFQIDVEIENRKYQGNDKHWILRAGADLNIRIHFDEAVASRAQEPSKR